MAEPFRYKPRREKLHIDDEGLLDRISQLGAVLPLSSGLELAAISLSCSRSTLLKFMQDHPEARDAWKTGRHLARMQFAKRGEDFAKVDPATWRFLAKQERYLGMSDTPKTDKVIVEAAEESKKLRTREELMARIKELSTKVPVEIDGEAEEVRPAPNQGIPGRSIARRG